MIPESGSNSPYISQMEILLGVEFTRELLRLLRNHFRIDCMQAWQSAAWDIRKAEWLFYDPNTKHAIYLFYTLHWLPRWDVIFMDPIQSLSIWPHSLSCHAAVLTHLNPRLASLSFYAPPTQVVCKERLFLSHVSHRPAFQLSLSLSFPSRKRIIADKAACKNCIFYSIRKDQSPKTAETLRGTFLLFFCPVAVRKVIWDALAFTA
jgi:hypothetical protein